MHGIHAATVDRLKHNMSVNTEIIDRLCKILDCQPGDIMEYVPDDNE
jgi:DNA-binding Xre family transcriptional regulator